MGNMNYEEEELKRKKYEIEQEILYLKDRQEQLKNYLWNAQSDEKIWEMYHAVQNAIVKKLWELKQYDSSLPMEDSVEAYLQNLQYYYQKHEEPKPVINWKYYLGIDDNRNPNLRSARRNIVKKDDGTYSNLEAYSKPEMKTEILIDANGCEVDLTLNAFLWQCQYLLPYTQLRVGWFNDKFYGWHEIKSLEDIEKNLGTFDKWGGATDFNIPFDTFSEDADKKVIFTGVYGSNWHIRGHIPDRSLDAIWLVYSGYEIHPKGGIVKEVPIEIIENMDGIYERVLWEKDQKKYIYRPGEELPWVLR